MQCSLCGKEKTPNQEETHCKLCGTLSSHYTTANFGPDERVCCECDQEMETKGVLSANWRCHCTPQIRLCPKCLDSSDLDYLLHILTPQ